MCVDITETYLALLVYSSDSCITGEQLEEYILKLIPAHRLLYNMWEERRKDYAFVASRRFLFFLQKRSSDRVSIERLVHSEVMEEFFKLERPLKYPDTSRSKGVSDNAFSYENMRKIWKLFIDLDIDQDDALSRTEFMEYRGLSEDQSRQLSLTPLATECVFEVMGGGEASWTMEFGSFVDVHLIFENRELQQSKDFLWRLLSSKYGSVEGTGALPLSVCAEYYSQIAASVAAPPFKQIYVEMVDMVQGDRARGISYDDVMKSSNGAKVLMMFLDVNTLKAFETRPATR